jgi:hypothetical protein
MLPFSLAANYICSMSPRTTCVVRLVFKEAWVETINFVGKKCSFVIAGLIVELENNF